MKITKEIVALTLALVAGAEQRLALSRVEATVDRVKDRITEIERALDRVEVASAE